ncbi:MAG: hypothetical protein IPM64_17990 [Phycisphaerales bacterium]|nr:hypothetical protein [Phycisphaerales bacterium]
MAIANPFKLDKVVLPSSVEFSHVENVRCAPEIETLLSSPAGHPFPMFRGNARLKPLISFTTEQVDVVLANIGAGGLSVTSASYLYFALATLTGKVARATTSHTRMAVNQLVAYWTTIRFPHSGFASADVVLAAGWDGTNNPIVPGGSVALSGNLAAGNRFGAGPNAVNGSALDGIQEFTCTSGVRLIEAGGESEVYNSFVGIEAGTPQVDVSYIGPNALTTFGLNGTVLNGSSGWLGYGRKFTPNGDRVANATAEHLYLQALLGTVKVLEAGGQGAQLGMNRIQIDCVASSDSVVPLTAAVLQAIA